MPTLHFDADLSDWIRATGGLAAKCADLTAAHEEIGDFLTAEAVGNIDTDGGGTKWPPLSPTTLKRRPRPGNKALVVTGELRRSLKKSVTREYVDVGSSLADVKYARAQFYGYKNIPKRSPFVWRSGTLQYVAEIYARHILSGAR